MRSSISFPVIVRFGRFVVPAERSSRRHHSSADIGGDRRLSWPAIGTSFCRSWPAVLIRDGGGPDPQETLTLVETDIRNHVLAPRRAAQRRIGSRSPGSKSRLISLKPAPAV